MKLKPQPGYQEQFLSTPADIAIGGGAAGCGKTFSLLLEPLRHIKTYNFSSTFFRKTRPQIRMQGGLWDASSEIYSNIPSSKPVESKLNWSFPNRVNIKFNQLEHEKSVQNYQGAEIPLICFDELTHFSKNQFFYMLSRNRTTIGIKGYTRATCNPDPDSFVRTLIDWWIGPDGFPIAERSGKLRYFMVHEDSYVFGSSYNEVIEASGGVIKDQIDKINARTKGAVTITAEHLIKSITFISGSIYENSELLRKNPQYLGDLNSLPADQKSRLLDGNWNIRIRATDVVGY